MDTLRGIHLDYLLLSLPAGFFWLWYVGRKARAHPPPAALVLLAFVLGGLSPIGVVAADDFVSTHPLPWLPAVTPDGDVFSRLLYFVLYVGLIEEMCKMLVVRYTVYYSRTFDDVLHGVVYSSAAALGFATVENAYYIEWHGPGVLVGRVIMSTFGHVLLSMVWGFALGAQRTRRPTGLSSAVVGWLVLAGGVLLGAVLHGVYDFFLVNGQMWLALLLLFTLWRIFLAQTEFVRHHSPHRRKTSRRVRECTGCHGLVRDEGRFCGSCGTAVSVEAGTFCASCGKAVGSADGSCAACGLLLR